MTIMLPNIRKTKVNLTCVMNTKGLITVWWQFIKSAIASSLDCLQAISVPNNSVFSNKQSVWLASFGWVIQQEVKKMMFYRWIFINQGVLCDGQFGMSGLSTTKR